MGVLIFIGIVIVLLVMGFLISLIAFKNRVFVFHEDIKRAKSRVRVTQNKYVKAIRNTNEALKLNANNPGAGHFWNGDMGSAVKYDSNIDFVSQLAEEYERAQNALNNLVNEYNNYIGTFPNSVLASIFKYTPESYIDEDNFEQSISLAGIDNELV